MTDGQKLEILSLSYKAKEIYDSYRMVCENIQRLIKAYTNEDVNDVLYKEDNGVVVAVESENEIWVDDEIPIETFMNKEK